MSIPDPRILLQAETLALADRLGAEDTVSDLVGLVSRLRKEGHPQERVHHALEQVRLRRKARQKLGLFANRMLFTEAGLEQATRLVVAAHHAGRFQRGGITKVADLGCGLGVDSMAMAALGIQVTAVERDEFTAALATYNLAPFDTAHVVHGDALGVDLSEFDGLWLDPARREGSARLSDPSQWSPSLDDAFRLAGIKPSGVKLAPGIDRDLLPAGCEWQWVSVDGDVVEVVVWSGQLARPNVGRSALVLRGEKADEMTGDADAPDEAVGDIGAFVYEPDGAVIRARLIGDLARSLGGRMIDPTIAYITTDTPHDSPFAAGFRIDQVMPLKTAAIKKWARENNVGTLEIKKRGVDIDPATFRTTLGLSGEKSATLILTRVAGKKVALAATRLTGADTSTEEGSRH